MAIQTFYRKNKHFVLPSSANTLQFPACHNGSECSLRDLEDFAERANCEAALEADLRAASTRDKSLARYALPAGAKTLVDFGTRRVQKVGRPAG